MPGYQVHQLSEAHRPRLLSFLRRDPVNNLFLVGDVTTFGVRGRNIGFWGAFRGANLAGIAVLLGDSASFYAPERACLDQLLPMVSRAQNLSGELGLLEDVVSRLPPQRLVWSMNQFFCRLEAGSFQPREGTGVRPAVAADLDLLTGLYIHAAASSRLNRGQVLEQMERQLATVRFHIMVIGNEIVCAAAANSETKDVAMIASVLTAPAARNQGHASAVVSSLCAEFLARGKTPHLFYHEDNDAAGRVYQKLGFGTIGRWKLARLSPIG